MLIDVPGARPAGPVPTPRALAVKEVAEQWYVQAPNGQRFGPLPRAELDDWSRAGRLVEDTQLLRAGESYWIWARDLYPHLAPPRQAPPIGGAAPLPIPLPHSIARQSNRHRNTSDHIAYMALSFYIFAIFDLVVTALIIMWFVHIGEEAEAEQRDLWHVITWMSVLVGGLGAACASFQALTGIGLQQRYAWARILAMLQAGLFVTTFPVGTAIGAWMLVVLWDRETKQLFK
jgi:hypothetical protein